MASENQTFSLLIGSPAWIPEYINNKLLLVWYSDSPVFRTPLIPVWCSNSGLNKFSPAFKWHSNTGPFGERTAFDHLKTGLVWESDPQCKIFFQMFNVIIFFTKIFTDLRMRDVRRQSRLRSTFQWRHMRRHCRNILLVETFRQSQDGIGRSHGQSGLRSGRKQWERSRKSRLKRSLFQVVRLDLEKLQRNKKRVDTGSLNLLEH